MKFSHLALSILTVFLYLNSNSQIISGRDTVCQYDTAVYISTTTSSQYIYHWNVTGGYIHNENEHIIQVRWLYNSLASVSLAVYDTFGVFHSSQNLSILINPRPYPFITSDFESKCSGETEGGLSEILPDSSNCLVVCDSSTVTYQVPNEPGSSYLWVVSNAVDYDTSGNSVTVDWGGAGYGAVKVTVVNSEGCEAESEICVKIVDRPLADFSSIPAKANGDTIEVCKNQPLYLFDNSINAVKWYWIFGDGGISNVQNPHHRYDTSGTYNAMLIVENNCSCRDTSVFTVQVSEDRGPDIYCVGTVCQGSNTYSTSDSCSSYNWSVTGGTIVSNPDSSTIVVNWGNNPSGYGILNLNVGSCSGICASNTVLVPTISNNVVIDGKDTVCGNSQEKFIIPEAPGSIYNWTVSGGTFAFNGLTSISGPNLNEVNVNWNNNVSSGSLTVTVFNDPLNCADTVNKSVVIMPEYKVNGLKEGCFGEEMTFSTNTSGSYTWRITNISGDVLYGPTLGTNSLNYTFNNFGRFIVQAANASGFFCNNSAIHIVDIKQSAVDTSSITGDTLICPGKYYEYEQLFPVGDYILEWVFQNGNPATVNGNKVVASWDNSGPWAIITSYQNPNFPFCKSVPDTQNVYHIPNPKPVISGNDSVCENSAGVYLTSKVADKYDWAISPVTAGSISSGQFSSAINVQWNGTSQDYDTAYIMLSAQLCDSAVKDTMTIIIKGRYEPEIQVDSAYCPGDTLTFVDLGNDTSTLAWIWNFGDGTTIIDSVDNTIDYIYYTGGRKRVNLTVSYEGVCSDNRRDAIMIKGHDAPQGSLGIDQWEICKYTDGDSVWNTELKISVQGDTNDYWYRWYNGDSLLFGLYSSRVQYDPDTTGIYSVEIYNKSTGCAFLTNEIDLSCDSGTFGGCTVDRSGTISLTATDLGCGLYKFTNSYSGPGYSFVGISFGQGEGSSSLDTSVHFHQYSKAGVYSPFISIQANCGGLNTYDTGLTITIPVIPDFSLDYRCDIPDFVIEALDKSTYLDTAPSDWNWYLDGVLDPAYYTGGYAAAPGSGTYDIKMEITAGSITCDTTKSITIGDPAIAFADIQSSPYCEGTPILFMDTSQGNIIKWDWEFIWDSTISDVQSPYKVFSEFSNSFEIVNLILRVTDSTGCYDTIAKQISVNQNELFGAVTIFPSNIPIICEGDSQQLSVNYTGGSSLQDYLWSNLDSTSTIYVKSTGEISVKVTDNKGCIEKSGGSYIGVQPLPIANIWGSKEQYCVGEEIKLYNYRGSELSYTWKRNGTQIGTDSAITLIESSPGTVTIEAISMDQYGCGDTDTIELEIVSGPNISNITASPKACESALPTLAVTASGSGALKYNWSNGGTGSYTVVQIANIYEVKVTDSVGCTSDTSIQVYPMPDFAAIMTGCYEYCQDSMPQVWQGLGTQFYHNWINLSGGSLSSSSTYTVDTTVKTYEFRLIASNNGGCVDTSGVIEIAVYDCDCSEVQSEIDSIWCVSDDSNGIWTYGFNLLSNYSGSGSMNLNITGFNGTLSKIQPIVVQNGDTITGLFTPDTTTIDSLKLHVRFGSSSFGICDTTLIDTLPSCYAPCDMLVEKDTLICVDTQFGKSVFYYDISFNNRNGLPFQQSPYPAQNTASIGGNTLNNGITHATGLWASNSVDTCVRFSLFNADSLKCCGFDYCNDSLTTCSASNCSMTMNGNGLEIVCMGPDSLGNMIFAFRIDYTSYSNNNAYYTIFSDSAVFHSVQPMQLQTSDSLYGYFTYTGSSYNDFDFHIVSYNPGTNSKCYTTFTTNGLSSCTFDTHPCGDFPEIQNIVCLGYDNRGYPIYKATVYIENWLNQTPITAISRQATITNVNPNYIYPLPTNTFDVTFAADTSSPDSICFAIVISEYVDLTHGHCTFTLCETTFPACCDQDTVVQFMKLKPPYSLLKEEDDGKWEKGEFYFKMIPNPADNLVFFNYALQSGENNHIVIRNMHGNVIQRIRQIGNSGNIEFSTANLESGMYFVTLIESNNFVETKKLIIVH